MEKELAEQSLATVASKTETREMTRLWCWLFGHNFMPPQAYAPPPPPQTYAPAPPPRQ